MWTLESYIAVLSDRDLLGVFDELYSGRIPRDGEAHALRKIINEFIDDGKMEATSNFRNVYIKTIAPLVYRELAHRYAQNMDGVL